MSIRGAIFDLDGTLLNSMYVWDTMGERYLRAHGISPRADVNETVCRMSLYQAACYFQQEYGVCATTDEIMAQVNAMAEHAYRVEVPLKVGVATFLARLQRQGVAMCVATATDRPLVTAALDRLGVLHYFTRIFTCTEVGHGKDEPHIFEQACAALDTAKHETAVFEDALHAAQTAKRAGFLLAAVQDASEPHSHALRALADWYIEDFTNAEEVFA